MRLFKPNLLFEFARHLSGSLDFILNPILMDLHRAPHLLVGEGLLDLVCIKGIAHLHDGLTPVGFSSKHFGKFSEFNQCDQSVLCRLKSLFKDLTSCLGSELFCASRVILLDFSRLRFSLRHHSNRRISDSATIHKGLPKRSAFDCLNHKFIGRHLGGFTPELG